MFFRISSDLTCKITFSVYYSLNYLLSSRGLSPNPLPCADPRFRRKHKVKLPILIFSFQRNRT